MFVFQMDMLSIYTRIIFPVGKQLAVLDVG